MVIVRRRRLKLLVTALAEHRPRPRRPRNPIAAVLPTHMDDEIRLLATGVVAARARVDRRMNHVGVDLVHVLCESALLNEALAAAGYGACMLHGTRMLQDMVIHRVRSLSRILAMGAYIVPRIVLCVLGRHSCMHPTPTNTRVNFCPARALRPAAPRFV